MTGPYPPGNTPPQPSPDPYGVPAAPQPVPYDPWQPGPAQTQQFPPVYQPQLPAQAPTPVRPPKRHVALKILGSVMAFLLIACVIAVAKVGVGGFLDGLGRKATPTGAVPSGISATSTETAAPTGPFEDTPAAEYPEGAAGITLPAAVAVTGFSKSQVAAALTKVKQGLIAARLDPKMLVARDTSGLVNLLAPDARTDIRKNFTDQNFVSFASQIAPGYTLTSDKARVKGRVTFRAKTEDSIRLLEVITNFVWVYPFSGELSDPGDHLVIVHDEVHWVFPVNADVENSSRGMWINEAESYASNIDCELLKKSLLALGKPQLIPGGSNEDENAMFDPNRSLDIADTC